MLASTAPGRVDCEIPRWNQSQIPGDVPMRTLAPKTLKKGELWDPISVEEGNMNLIKRLTSI